MSFIKNKDNKEKKVKKDKSNRPASNTNTLNFKRGTYSAGIVGIVLIIAIVINLIVAQLPSSVISIDMSSEDYYSISDTTEELLDSLDDDIVIYFVTTDADAMIEKLLDVYTEYSDKITVEVVDPEEQPTFLSSYDASDLNDNSLIVTCGDSYQTIDYNDIYETDYSDYYTTGSYTTDFDAEGEITSAIDYVTSDDLPIIYALTGNGEEDLSDACTTVEDELEQENFAIKSLSLLEEGEVPDDCDILLIVAPTEDISEDEADMILEYMEAGGQCIYISNYAADVDMTNLETVLDAYGMELTDDYIEDTSSYYQYEYYILADVQDTDITSDIVDEDLYILAPYAQGITETADDDSDLEFTDLLLTSDSGILLDTSDNTAEVADGAEAQEYSLAKMATLTVTDEDTEEETTSTMVVFSSYYMFTDSITEDLTPGNSTLLVDTCNTLCDHESNIDISSKSLSVDYNTVSTTQANLWFIVIVVVVPVVIVAYGFIVWFRRRRG